MATYTSLLAIKEMSLGNTDNLQIAPHSLILATPMRTPPSGSSSLLPQWYPLSEYSVYHSFCYTSHTHASLNNI